MSRNAIEYLNKHKGEYTKESLVEALRAAGYRLDDIVDGIRAVYGEESNFSEATAEESENDIHIYSGTSDKVKDFIIGLLLSLLFTVIPVIGWILGILFLIRYFRLRRYRFYGLCVIYVPALLFIARWLLDLFF